MTDLAGYLAAYDTVPGWFYPPDLQLFLVVNELQRRADVRGHLLEIGVYQGRSASLIGYLVTPGERFVACDLFDAPATTPEGSRENRHWYKGLTQADFEHHYLRFHQQLPELVVGPSSRLDARYPPASFRFIHIDGSHAYQTVRDDLRLARKLLVDGGVLVVDDWRAAHTPGVMAAAWQAILGDGLCPLFYSDQKLYASWSTHLLPRPGELAALAGEPALTVEVYDVFDRAVARVTVRDPLTHGSPGPARREGRGSLARQVFSRVSRSASRRNASTSSR